MTQLKFVRLWSIVMGSMDALTGLWLITWPAGVLQVLAIPLPSADAMVFLSWIGTFVMAVGLSYALALGSLTRAATVWWFTAMVRLLVAAFLTTKMLSGALVFAWLPVAVSDATVALVQLALLRTRWWREVPR